MSDAEVNMVATFAKNATEVVGVGVTEWKGEPRIDVRIYVPAVAEDCLVPTRKGISLAFDFYPQFLEGIRQLGDVMSSEKTVARIGKSRREEIRIGTNTYKGHNLIYVRTFSIFGDEDPEWKPTKKGVSLRVDLYLPLLEAVEALGPVIAAGEDQS